MYFPPKEVLDDIRAFDALPSTPYRIEQKLNANILLMKSVILSFIKWFVVN